MSSELWELADVEDTMRTATKFEMAHLALNLFISLRGPQAARTTGVQGPCLRNLLNEDNEYALNLVCDGHKSVRARVGHNRVHLSAGI